MEKISFQPADGAPVDFFVIAQTTVSGKTYILVTDAEEGDGEALIMRDDSDAEDGDALYSIVEDEAEFDALSRIFGELLEEDITLES